MAECMKNLYIYLNNHMEEMSRDWVKTIDNSSSKFYSTDVSESSYDEIIKSHRILLANVLKVFTEEESVYIKEIKGWANIVAEKRANALVPITESIQQLNVVEGILLRYVEKFSEETSDRLTVPDMFQWIRHIHDAFDLFVDIFIESYDNYKHKQLLAQQETIYELSSPIIPITKQIGVLPLVGDIDTKRAYLIMENTLTECNDKHFSHIFIDLSGVSLIDTMVAHQLFQVIHALKLIGVNGYLSGLRPEVAQTAIQLGVDFSKIPIYNNLASALERLGLAVDEAKYV